MTSNQPPRLLTRDALTRANVLGLGLLVLFAASAGIVYVLLGVSGWDSGAGRILAALLLGPIMVSIGFGFWFLRKRYVEQS